MSVSILTHVTVSPGELDVLRYILGFPQHHITTELSHRRIPECCCQSDDSVLICGDVEFDLTFRVVCIIYHLCGLSRAYLPGLIVPSAP